MINAAEKHLKYTKETPIKPWINSKIINLIENRRMQVTKKENQNTTSIETW